MRVRSSAVKSLYDSLYIEQTLRRTCVVENGLQLRLYGTTAQYVDAQLVVGSTYNRTTACR